MDYRDYQPTLSPRPLNGNYGNSYWTALGDVKDSETDRCREALLSRFLKLGIPYDVLSSIGEERQIIRGLTETDASYITRLLNAWTTWKWSGTAYGILRSLYDIGYTTPLIEVVKGLEYSLDGSGNLVINTLPAGMWTIDAQVPLMWNKFNVIFPLNSFSPVPAESSDKAQQIVSIVQRMKPAFTICAGIIVVTANNLLGYPHKVLDGTYNLGSGSRVVWSVP